MQNQAIQTARAARDSAVREATQLQQELVQLLLYPHMVAGYLVKSMLLPQAQEKSKFELISSVK